jgi:3-phenylpropionate/cinnamic acid dioxygenase small subunit
MDHNDIESFLYREARLLDEHDYDGWESLWTDDCVYWVPCNEDDSDPLLHVSIIYDDRMGIRRRVERLKSGTAWAQEPKSRMRRVVSNIEMESEDSPDVTVYSNFSLSEYRSGVQTTWVGRTIHRLRPENGGIRMSFKKVMLINNDAELPNMVFLI